VHDASIAVLKFGGSVLRDRAALGDAAREVARVIARGERVIAVVSALRGRTEELLAECRAEREPLSANAIALRVGQGERECAASLVVALKELGIDATALDPASMQLVACGDPLDADLVSVSLPHVHAALARHSAVVVPGFVAIDDRGNAVLLGRGGSDLTAMFLAQRLSARCRLVKDVDGLHDADPAALRDASQRRRATYAEVAQRGGQLVQSKALAFARANGFAFEIGALFRDTPTIVGADAAVAHRTKARIAVIGSRGMVGAELRLVLAQRGHGEPLGFANASDCEGAALDVAFLAVSAEAALALAPKLLANGVRVVDCSSAFRERSDVPLVVPEVNARDLASASNAGLVASPNCSATMLVLALAPLHAAFGIEHVSVATYQAVSGAGRAAVEALESETKAQLSGVEPVASAFPQPCAFNVFPHESALDDESLCNEEEQKLVAESRRILGQPSLPIDASCARVPVRRAHCQAVVVTLSRHASLVDVRAALQRARGVSLLPDAGPDAASARHATSRDELLVSRIRWAQSELDKPEGERRRVALWLACDQLRKGAALNAVQLAEAAGWI
jgi:aspartate-semialdehyde dehydrogenase